MTIWIWVVILLVLHNFSLYRTYRKYRVQYLELLELYYQALSEKQDLQGKNESLAGEINNGENLGKTAWTLN